MTRESSLLDGPSVETLTCGWMVMTGVTRYLRCLRRLRNRHSVSSGASGAGSLTWAASVDSADLRAVRLRVSRRFVGSLCVEPEKGTLSAKAGEAEVVAGHAGPAG